MTHQLNFPEQTKQHSCCPSGSPNQSTGNYLNRRDFIKTAGGTTLTMAALPGLTWAGLAGMPASESFGIVREPLKVKPVLVYSTPRPKPQTSWRHWGGIQTQQDAVEEQSRIRNELTALKQKADFPLEFLPVSGIRNTEELAAINDLQTADTLLVYAAGGWMDVFDALHGQKKDMIFFCRHKSGPVYLWYEIISPRYLRQHTDKLAVTGVDEDDVVIDNQDEILWRLRSLCGLKNTLDSGIMTVGGQGGWAQPRGLVPQLVEDKFRLKYHMLDYDELGGLIREARQDNNAVKRAKQRAGEYLRGSGTSLETERTFVDNAFLLEDIFKKVMDKAGCRAMTINSCMGTIMPLAETSACLTLSLLNDSGYLSFCESDFVVIPAGILLGNISGRPVFLNDPTYPHDGIITLAHCTAPRRMDGRQKEPARILTHFESDYGAAPKVEMHKGQTVTNIIPDFQVSHYVGLKGTIIDHPFMDICRSQIDISYEADSQVLAKRMPGFHWMTGYGDYTRETGYALKRIGIEWEQL